MMDAKPTHAGKKGVKKRREEEHIVNCEATGLAFSRLGVILHEIAQDAINNSTSFEREEGGDLHVHMKRQSNIAKKGGKEK